MFPFTRYQIRKAIDRPFCDLNNISNMILEYHSTSPRYRYEFFLQKESKINFTYHHAVILAKDPEEFAKVFSCTMYMQGGSGCCLSYDDVLTGCSRTSDKVYDILGPKVLCLQSFRDPNGDETSRFVLSYHKGEYRNLHKNIVPGIMNMLSTEWYWPFLTSEETNELSEFSKTLDLIPYNFRWIVDHDLVIGYIEDEE